MDLLFLLCFVIVGICAGCITGLVPGLHINLIAVLALGLSGFDMLAIIVFILAMSITHTFVDVIPSVYLGAPDPSLALIALPGHKLFLEGKAFEAVALTTFGGLIGLVFALLLSVPFGFVVGFYPLFEPYIGYVLLALLCILLLRERAMFWAIVFFICSGCLGLLVFKIPLEQPLLALLSGLFGVSLLVLSSSGEDAKQTTVVRVFRNWWSGLVATLVGMVAAFLPGFGASQAAIYGTLFVKQDERVFLVLSGGINTVAMLVSLITFWSLAKARNGSVVAISELLGTQTQLSIGFLLVLFCVMTVSAGIAGLVTLRMARAVSAILANLPYKFVVWCVILFLVSIVFYFDLWVGLLVLVCATALGIWAQKVGVAKHYLLGCLLLPVLLYFL